MTPKPYVGITGPVNLQETKDICKEFQNAGYFFETTHIPMLGFLMSYKKLNNQSLQNRRYPEFNELPELLQATNKNVLRMIHYNTKQTDTLSEQIEMIFDGLYETELCRSLQLNIVWPEINQVKKIKEKHPDMLIVFQASHKAMEGRTPEQIAKGIKEYNGLIEYVLIDPSGGRGMPFDLETSLKIYSQIKEKNPNLTIGFAGGLSGENVASRVNDIIKKIGNDFCIDAEGGLRDKLSEEYGDDTLNINKVKDYLQESIVIRK